MAYSSIIYSGNGSQTTFAVPFPFLDRSHVAVTVGGFAAAFTWDSNSQIRCVTAPVSGVHNIRIKRTTLLSALVTFSDGSTLTAANLNRADLQNLYLTQEAQDTLALSITLPDIPESYTVSRELPTIAERALKNVYFDASGAFAAGTPIIGGTTVSAAMIPVVTAATKLLAITAMGPFSTAVVRPTSGTVDRTLATRFADTVNPRDYGAQGDGTTDDTVAIQAVLNTGKQVILTGGTYLVGALTTTGLSVFIEGYGGATLKAKATAAGGSLLAIVNASRLLIRGVTFDGNRANVTGSGFGNGLLTISNTLAGSDSALVTGCAFTSAPYFAIYATSCLSIQISGNSFWNCFRDVIFCHSNVFGCAISDNTFKMCPGTGIKVHGFQTPSQPTWTSSRVSITGNTIDYNEVVTFSAGDSTLGIEVWGNVDSVTVSGNVIKGPAAGITRIYGISLDAVSYATVTGNSVSQNIGIALECAGSKYVSYVGNSVFDCDIGLSASQATCTPCVFSANTIKKCSTFGLQLFTSDVPWTISGNMFVDVLGRNVFMNGVGAGSTVTGNTFVSETMTASVDAVHLAGAHDTLVSSNNCFWKNAVAACFTMTNNALRSRFIGNNGKAGLAVASNFITAFASADRGVYQMNCSHLYNNSTIDTAACTNGFSFVSGNWNDTGGGPSNTKVGDTVTNNAQYL